MPNEADNGIDDYVDSVVTDIALDAELIRLFNEVTTNAAMTETLSRGRPRFKFPSSAKPTKPNVYLDYNI